MTSSDVISTAGLILFFVAAFVAPDILVAL